MNLWWALAIIILIVAVSMLLPRLPKTALAENVLSKNALAENTMTSRNHSTAQTHDTEAKLWQRLREYLRREATSATRRRESAALLRQFASLLQSGRSEAQVWADLHSHWRSHDPQHAFTGICAQAAAAERSGMGADQGLWRSAVQCEDQEISRMLHRLLAAVRLSAQTGAPLSQLAETMADAVDSSAQLNAAVETSVAGPKLTQLILTLLPAGGMMLGQLMGSSPVRALLGGPIGWLCLLLGVSLVLAGRFWSRRMMRRVTEQVA